MRTPALAAFCNNSIVNASGLICAATADKIAPVPSCWRLLRWCLVRDRSFQTQNTASSHTLFVNRRHRPSYWRDRGFYAVQTRPRWITRTQVPRVRRLHEHRVDRREPLLLGHFVDQIDERRINLVLQESRAGRRTPRCRLAFIHKQKHRCHAEPKSNLAERRLRPRR